MAFPASGDGRRSDRKGPRQRQPAPKGPQDTGGAGTAGLRAAAAGLAGRAARIRSTGRPRTAPPRTTPIAAISRKLPGAASISRSPQAPAHRAMACRARSRPGNCDAQTSALRAKPAQAAACARAKGASRRRAIRPEPGVQRGQRASREPWRSRKGAASARTIDPRTIAHRSRARHSRGPGRSAARMANAAAGRLNDGRAGWTV